jgi:2-polyprenyl-3-methyl-5-hydroxy-6-metoxy-1,4-benzoquinol methylase
MANKNPTFDYSAIRPGYYDEIALRKKGIRSFWHQLKFARVIAALGKSNNSILDIGCFGGTFLGMIPETTFSKQVGIDILEEQVEYANKKYGTHFRKFFLTEDIKSNGFSVDGYFDVITLIEVVEHLTKPQIADIITFAHNKLKPNGRLVITTPNYTSAWPLIEFILNKVSDVKYEEQHITRFNYFNVVKKLGRIVPGFSAMFQTDFKTTTHLLTPFIAGISFKTADRISATVSPAKWKLPLGMLLLIHLIKETSDNTTYDAQNKKL